MNKKIYILIIVIVTIFNSCRKPYLPPLAATSTNYLVVEGTINTGQDSTIIKLSRTIPLSSTTGTKPELNAKVAVESSVNGSYPLTDAGNGNYVSPGLNLSALNQYRLKITTTDNKIYQSDFVPVKNSKPIDSVYYQAKSNGVQVYADTHDPSGNSTYYRWEFNETWIIHSEFNAVDILVRTPKDTVIGRKPAQQIYQCFASDVSQNILLNSSAKLAKDVITGNQVDFIPASSEKIADRYSILVKQYALTKEAYDYWQQLKKNTEQLGTIFDAQPSEIAGNIHCISNASEPVLGYISAGTYAQQRIFIDSRTLPAYVPFTPLAGCMLDSLYFSGLGGQNEVKLYIYGGYKMPVYTLVAPGVNPRIIGYATSDPICVDCTLRGTATKPSFWIDD